MSSDLGKLLLLLGTAYASKKQADRRRGIEDEERKRQKTFDQITLDRAAREKAEYERRTNAPIDATNWMNTQPGAPGYAPAPEVPMFPDMPTNITTGGSGRYQPGSPMPGAPPPLKQAGPAPTPWGTEEEAARALAGSGLSPEAMDIALGRLRMGLPSEAEKRMDEMVTLPDGRQVRRGDADFEMRLNPPVAPPREGEIATVKRTIQDAIGLATALGRTDILAILQGLTLNSAEEVANAREIAANALNSLLTASGKKMDEDRNAVSLGLGVQEAARIAGPRDIPIGPDARYQNLATGAPTPRETPSLSRQSVLPELAKIQDPIARAEAERQFESIFDQQEKLQLKAKEPQQVYRYRYNRERNAIEEYAVPGELLPPDQAKTVTNNSLKAAQDESKYFNPGEVADTAYTTGPKTDLAEARTAKVILETELMPVKLKIDSEFKDATIRLRQAGLELRAKGMEQSYQRWLKTFNQRVAEGQFKQMVATRNLARNDAGVLKAYIEVMSKEAATLAATNYKTEDGKWYSKQGLTEAEFKAKLTEVQGAIAEVMPDYEARVKELINSSGVGPMAPPTSGVTPPTTGAPTGLPTIDPKAERGKIYNEAAAAAKISKIKDATTGKMRPLTPEEQQKTINIIMRNRGLI